MDDKILDSELLDRDQEFERIKQLRQEKIAALEDPVLKAIAQRESSGGLNTRHREMKRGMHEGDQAGGGFGIMPKAAIDEVKLSPEFLEKHPEFTKSMQDNKLITEDLNNNPDMDIELAKTILARRAGRLDGNIPDTIYSWHHGVQGALNNRKKKDLSKDDYTKSVLAEIVKTQRLPASK